jgi:two-component system, OmpR family, sensor kinase
MRSIERTVAAWILGALTLGSLLVGLATYLVTLDEMNEVFDADLKNIAEAVASYHQTSYTGAAPTLPEPPPRTDVPEDTEIVTLTWTRAGQRVYASDPRVRVPYIDVEGLSRPVVEGESWIVYSRVTDAGVAQAAQRESARQEMAGESAAEAVPPMLILVVFVGGLLVVGLRRGLQPLDRTAREIAARSEMSLDPITPGDVPREIVPLVTSINGLMGRLAAAFSLQRRFLADAAHELRTPITALRLQLTLLRQSADAVSREAAMAELEAGIARSQRLVEQLLQFARSEPAGKVRRVEPVDLGELVRSVVGTLSAKAEKRGIDLGAAGPPGIAVPGDREQLTVLLDNLVENALRFTPQGGVVDVVASTRDDRAELRVIDNGPGIPEAERARVFDRFHRGEDALKHARDSSGSGLGLAIVRAIADQHAADVSLHTPATGRGLEVRVLFPVRGATDLPASA